MAKNRYDAKINNNPTSVDLFDLPYDKFNEQNPLIVQGPVILTEQTRTTDLSNVHIIGGFDISKQKIAIDFPAYIEGPFICRSCTQVKSKTDQKIKVDIFTDSFQFPKGITEIDCAHSIKDFDYFIGRIPATVKTIIVADNMLSTLSSDQDKLASAKRLLEKYPHLIVMGTKKKSTLSEEIENIEKPAEVIEQKPQIIETPVKPEIEPKETKTDIEKEIEAGEYWPKRDTACFLSDDPFIKSFKLPFSDIQLVVDRMWRYFNRTMVKEYGSELSCISFDDLIVLYGVFVEALTEAKKEAEAEAQEGPKPQKPAPVQKTEEATIPVVVSEPTPLSIKKYIPGNMWGDITKLCGNKTQTIKFVLNTISSVNTDINKTNQGNAIQIIDPETKSKTTCGYMKKESGNCVVQSVDAPTSNDRKRIVWTYLPKEQILVCIGAQSEHFCSTGQNKNSLLYKTNRIFAAKNMDANGVKLTIERIKNEKYFDVDILLEIIKSQELLKPIQSSNNPTLIR